MEAHKNPGQQLPVLIVGAGMAGLSCAVNLHQAGVSVCVLEADQQVGGRVQTDEVDGFLLDRGFQVYLEAYPETGALLNLGGLGLKPFKSGALIFRGGKLYRLMDVFRHPKSIWSSMKAPIGSWIDKLRVGLLRTKLQLSSLDAITAQEDRSTEAYLRLFGFSDEMIDTFFRTFYGGIFLERELRTSSRMFEFTFKMFSKGRAVLPAKGMGTIPRQLAANLPKGSVRLGAKVATVEPNGVVLQSGEYLPGSAVVIATDAFDVGKLLPNLEFEEPNWRSVTTLYFAAEKSPINEAIICLNGSGFGQVNSVSVLSDVAAGYAPSDQALLSVVVLGLAERETLEEDIKEELCGWFGSEVRRWRHLRTDRIERALPEQLPESYKGNVHDGFIMHEGICICGDHQSSASIEGAVVSGKQAAKAVLTFLKS